MVPLTFVSGERAGPPGIVDGKMNGLPAIYKLDFRKGQGRGRIVVLARLGKRGSQPVVIECWGTRIVLCIHQNELNIIQANFPIPEAVRLFDPVRRYIRRVNQMPHVARKKPLGTLVVLQGALRQGEGHCEEEQCNCDDS